MRKRVAYILLYVLILIATGSCSSESNTGSTTKDSMISCEQNLPSRLAVKSNDSLTISGETTSTEGMVWIKGGEYMMGAADGEGRPDEYPQHKVKLDGFWIDITEVTNAQFKKFTDATG